jgi:hypothetical protein
MRARVLRSSATLTVLGGFWIATASHAEPKTYVFSGKLTSNRGTLFNLPLIGNAPCQGVGLSNLTVMQGPGGKKVPASATPPTRTAGQPANESAGCVAHVKGRQITTTGAGVGGAFVMPTNVFSRPYPSYVAALEQARPFVQVATSFRVTGPRATPTKALGGSMRSSFPPAVHRAFKKGAWATQTGRQGSMFTWCWNNPACSKISQGTKPLIVKYSGGGNAFGGTMAYVINAGPAVASLAIAAGGGAVGFARFTAKGSQPTGRGYASSFTAMLAHGPLWAAYKTMSVRRAGRYRPLITMVTAFIGSHFPAAYHYNYGFPWTTMTVLARNTGTFGGNPRITTLTARGGDTVTAMGRRNLSLVAGGVARSVIGPVVIPMPEIGQMYLPEPRRSAQLGAGALALLAVASVRARKV